MIVRPLKSPFKRTCWLSTHRLRSGPHESGPFEGKMIVQPLKSTLKGTRSFATSSVSPRERRPIERKLIVPVLKYSRKGLLVLQASADSAEWGVNKAYRKRLHDLLTLPVWNTYPLIAEQFRSRAALTSRYPKWRFWHWPAR
jgi:hypothetical protein